MMRTEAMPVLVTGGAGFVGSWLVRALVAAGHPVRVIDDFSTGSPERLTGLAVQVVQADVRNEAAVRHAMEGAHVVFHLAWMGARPPTKSTQDLLRAEEVNVGGTLNVLEAARVLRPHRVVLASSGAVYGRTNAYVLHEEVAPSPLELGAVQHLAAEQYARVYREAHQLPTVILRLFNCYGPGERWRGDDVPLVARLGMAALEGRSPTIAGDPRQTRDLVYVENVVAALRAAAAVQGIEGGCYNVASGEAVTLQHLWRLLTRVVGFRADAPEARFVPATWPEPGHVRVSLARAARDLGYAPAILLHEGLQRTLDWLRREWSRGENGWFTPPSPIREPQARRASPPRLPLQPAARAAAAPSRPEAGGPPPLAGWWSGSERPSARAVRDASRREERREEIELEPDDIEPAESIREEVAAPLGGRRAVGEAGAPIDGAK